jgi:hypothetical protein
MTCTALRFYFEIDPKALDALLGVGYVIGESGALRAPDLPFTLQPHDGHVLATVSDRMTQSDARDALDALYGHLEGACVDPNARRMEMDLTIPASQSLKGLCDAPLEYDKPTRERPVAKKTMANGVAIHVARSGDVVTVSFIPDDENGLSDWSQARFMLDTMYRDLEVIGIKQAHPQVGLAVA